MIPTLQHTQPLVRDVSLQPAPARYLLTVYGTTSRKYFLVDEYVESDETMAFHRGNATWATVVLPKGSMWTLIHTDEIEFPSLESITRQTKTDQDHLLALEKELYPHKKVKKENGNGVVAFPDEIQEAYPGQGKQYL